MLLRVALLLALLVGLALSALGTPEQAVAETGDGLEEAAAAVR